jgi:hypothetical protein
MEEEIEQWSVQVELIARAAMLASGHHLHKRQWRKCRVRSSNARE